MFISFILTTSINSSSNSYELERQIMNKLHFSELTQGGFAGLKERQFVMDERVFGYRKQPKAANGLGNFVYLADANFFPGGETGMHPHKEVDVISVMVDGRVEHAGSLENGQNLDAGMSQVQRAGAEGFMHNEINPDDKENQMIQLWVLPDKKGERAGYQVFEPKVGKLQHIYGGIEGRSDTFYSNTSISVANLQAGQAISHQGDALVYLSKGEGALNSEQVGARTLLDVKDQVEFQAQADSQIILIYLTPSIEQ